MEKRGRSEEREKRWCLVLECVERLFFSAFVLVGLGCWSEEPCRVAVCSYSSLGKISCDTVHSMIRCSKTVWYVRSACKASDESTCLFYI